MEGTLTHPQPVRSIAERAAAEGRVAAMLDDLHREGRNAMKIADRLGDSELHRLLATAVAAVDDAQSHLTGSRS